MVNFGLQKVFMHIILIVGLANLVFMSGLLYLFGITGAACAILLAEISVAALAWFSLKRAGISLTSVYLFPKPK